jgi:hypothetical protein
MSRLNRYWDRSSQLLFEMFSDRRQRSGAPGKPHGSLPILHKRVR